MTLWRADPVKFQVTVPPAGMWMASTGSMSSSRKRKPLARMPAATKLAASGEDAFSASSLRSRASSSRRSCARNRLSSRAISPSSSPMSFMARF